MVLQCSDWLGVLVLAVEKILGIEPRSFELPCVHSESFERASIPVPETDPEIIELYALMAEMGPGLSALLNSMKGV